MYKVFICDDEKMGIKSLIATVDWAKNGFEVSGEAYDGLSALDLIIKTRPHLVITDIQMPGMSGLELMKKVSALNLKTLFVVISGYAEFAYVQKAINNGALGYLLKPFDELEISDILVKAKQSIDINKTSLETELLTLISDGGPDKGGRKIEIFKMLGFEWNRNTAITTIVIKGPKIVGLLSEFNCVDLRLGNTKNAYLIRTDDLKEVEKNLLNFIKVNNIIAGISNPCYQLDELDTAIYNASVAADQSFMTGKNGIYHFSASENSNFKDILAKLQKVLAKRDFTETMIFFDSIEETFTKGDYSVKQAIKFYNVIMYSFQAINIGGSGVIDDYEKLIETYKDVKEMLVFLRNMLVEPLGVYINSNTMDVKNETFRHVIKYVNEEFFEDLSIQVIAQKFSINANYVSQLFKKEIGVTFTEYLTNLRVNYAIRLLKTTELPISNVAEKSGFGDYFYFTRIFKKSTGQTPSAYRTQYSSGEKNYHPKIFLSDENINASGRSAI
jgi:two-component system response regulator YesN